RPRPQVEEAAPLDDAEEAAGGLALRTAAAPGLARGPRPGERALPGGRGRRALDRPGGALVEHHGDVHPHPPLAVNHGPGGEAEGGAVEVAAEGDAAGVHGAQPAQAEDLEAAAVGEDRPAPAGEGVQAAQLLDGVDPRPQGEVVEVGEHHGGPRRLQLLGGDPLDGAEGAPGHERRRVHRPAGRGQAPAAGLAFCGEDFERQAQGLPFVLPSRLRSTVRVDTPGGSLRTKRSWGIGAFRFMSLNWYSTESPSGSTYFSRAGKKLSPSIHRVIDFSRLAMRAYLGSSSRR